MSSMESNDLMVENANLKAENAKLKDQLAKAEAYAKHYTAVYGVIAQNDVRKLLSTTEKNVPKLVQMMIDVINELWRQLQSATNEIAGLRKDKESIETANKVLDEP